METMKEVSLGFAEFVSQLLHETFDAIMDTQNYQLEKYQELEKMLKLNDEAFKSTFITKEEIDDRIFDSLQLKIEYKMLADKNLQAFFNENFTKTHSYIQNGRLTQMGVEAIRDFFASALISEKRALMSAHLNASNTLNLVVDSGEIKAKLELSSLYSENATSNAVKPKTISKDARVPKSFEQKESVLLPTHNKRVKIRKHVDAKTGASTIFIDKLALAEIGKENVRIPDARLSATPAKMSSNSNLYSEVCLKFKVV